MEKLKGADAHYELMPTKDIIAMKDRINEFMHEDSHIYLWVTNNFLLDGLRLWMLGDINI